MTKFLANFISALLGPYIVQYVLQPSFPRLLAQYLDYVLVKVELSQVLAKPSAAVIGSGMSGLIAAHLLQETHDEAGPKCGLVGLQEELAPGVAVDVPLRFMMPHYYRHLLGVIRELGIPVRAVPYNAAYQKGTSMLMVTSTSWCGHIWQHLKYVRYLAKLMFTETEGESFLEYMTRHGLHKHEAYRIYSLHLSWMLSCTYEQANNTPAGVGDFMHLLASHPVAAHRLMRFIRASNPLVRMYQESLGFGDLRLGCPVKPFGGSRVIDGRAFDVVLVATDAAAAGYLLGGEWKERLEKIHYHKGCIVDLFETWNPAAQPAENLTIKEVTLGRATYTKAMKELSFKGSRDPL
eukprot:s7118_g1.t1